MERSGLKPVERLGEECYIGEARLPLPFGLWCDFTIEPKGLSDPDSDPMCVARAVILLPATSAGYLHEELRFGRRLEIFDNCMGCIAAGKDGRVRLTTTVSDTTWRGAYRSAESILASTYNSILAEMLAREEAMFSDGYELVIAHKMAKGAANEHPANRHR